jgi:hypothetical protein
MKRPPTLFRLLLAAMLASILAALAIVQSAFAADTFDTATGQLSISTLTTGSAVYSNVRVTVGERLPIGSVSGADNCSASRWFISLVQSGANTDRDVALAVSAADIVKSAGLVPRAGVEPAT